MVINSPLGSVEYDYESGHCHTRPLSRPLNVLLDPLKSWLYERAFVGHCLTCCDVNEFVNESPWV